MLDSKLQRVVASADVLLDYGGGDFDLLLGFLVKIFALEPVKFLGALVKVVADCLI